MTAPYHEAVDVKEKDLALDDQVDDNEIPQHVLDEIKLHSSTIYWSLFFLEGSVMWAFYSCLSAQDYYASTFPNVQFAFLTTPILTWPLSLGHIIQMWFGLDRALGNLNRVYIGYGLFAACGIFILIQGQLGLEEFTGATLILLCFGLVGAAHSLTEPAYYNVASLFPDEKFTNAIQVGNVVAGCINVTAATLIHWAVSGTDDSSSSVKLSFYIFMSLLLVVCVGAVIVYYRLEKIPCVRYLLDRAAADHNKHGKVSLPTLWAKFFRVSKVIVMPMVAQFMLFFCTLTLFPGFGISSVLKLPSVMSSSGGPWVISPGIIAPFNFGDLIGRLLSTKAAIKFFSLRFCFFFSFFRWVWLPLLLLGTATNSLYSFGDAEWSAYAFQVVLYVVLGITGGLFSTITMGMGPLLVPQEDREAAAALMVMFLFLGLSCGSTFGWVIGHNHWFGL